MTKREISTHTHKINRLHYRLLIHTGTTNESISIEQAGLGAASCLNEQCHGGVELCDAVEATCIISGD